MDAAFPGGGRGSVSGVGMGLRDPHFEALMADRHGVPWVELLADNFLARGGLQPRQLERIAERYPVTMHCVGMNLSGVDPLDFAYLGEIHRIAQTVEPAWVPVHPCFSRHAGSHYHDLLPLPFSDEAVRHIAGRIMQVQDFLGGRLLVENVSAYLRVEASLTEAEFLAAVCDEAGCDLLLDVNNLYVNQLNLGLDALQAIARLPLGRVREVHLAGFEDRGNYLVDAHNNRVSEQVWTLFAEPVARLDGPAVCVEWDNDIPALEVLLAEGQRAKAVMERARYAAA